MRNITVCEVPSLWEYSPSHKIVFMRFQVKLIYKMVNWVDHVIRILHGTNTPTTVELTIGYPLNSNHSHDIKIKNK